MATKVGHQRLSDVPRRQEPTCHPLTYGEEVNKLNWVTVRNCAKVSEVATHSPPPPPGREETHSCDCDDGDCDGDCDVIHLCKMMVFLT